MAIRPQRSHSLHELRFNVRRAKRFAERYGVDEAHPDDYQNPPPSDFQRLLNQIK